MRVATRQAPDGHNVFEDGHKPTEAEKLQPLAAVCPFCQARITYVSLTDDHNVRVPVDPGTVPDGALVVVTPTGTRAKGKRSFTVRLALPEDPRDHLRRQAHWATCRSTSGWQEHKRAAGLMRLANPTVAARVEYSRVGRCVRCWRTHAWRYGGPKASPVCDRCKVEKCNTLHPLPDGQLRVGELCRTCSTTPLLGEPY